MRISIGLKAMLGVAIVMVAAAVASWQGVEYYTARSEFCGGNCHTMTEQYEAWKASNHHAANSAEGSQAECIQCHFEPGGKKTLKAKFIGLRHLAAYMADPDAHLPVRAKIPDAACLSCHDKGKLRDQPIKYREKVTFKHGPHFDKPIEGQKVFCDTCHVKETQKNHFEVPQRTCFTCHFATADSEDSADSVDLADRSGPGARIPAKGGVQVASLSASLPIGRARGMNQGRGECATCHEIPTKSLQAQLEADDPTRKVITHQSLIEDDVACESCHLGVVEGTGAVRTEGCFVECHNRSDDLLATAGDGKLMHARHTATQRADCDDCHSPILHRKPDDYLEPARAACATCHRGAHEYQLILLKGASVAEGVPATPGLMDKVGTNCLGCHLTEKRSRGQHVKAGSAEGCIACHGPKHEKMVKDWKALLDKEVNGLRELAQEAAMLLDEAAQGGAPGEAVAEARDLIAQGNRYADIVAFGNGVHNKKYAIMIIDEAYGLFDDAIAVLEGV